MPIQRVIIFLSSHGLAVLLATIAYFEGIQFETMGRGSSLEYPPIVAAIAVAACAAITVAYQKSWPLFVLGVSWIFAVWSQFHVVQASRPVGGFLEWFFLATTGGALGLSWTLLNPCLDWI